MTALYRAVRLLSRRNTYVLILLMALFLLLAGTLLLWGFELGNGGEPRLRDMNEAFNYMLQNVSGVGLGAAVPQTFAGRVTAVIFVLLAAANRALFVAAIVSGFVNTLINQGKGVRRVNLTDHVIICGWNPRAKQIVQVLQREAFGGGAPVVVLANLQQNPAADADIKFVSGDTSSEADLQRAGVTHARSAIVISDETDGERHTDSTYDARSVLTVLALKSANPHLHVVAQVRDPANRHHFENARVDELIVSAEMTEGLLARSAVNTGIANVYSDLLRLDSAPEMYVVDAPPALEDKTFQQALIHNQLREGTILVGVVEDGTVVLCPPPEYKVHSGTRLVVMGNVRPSLDH